MGPWLGALAAGCGRLPERGSAPVLPPEAKYVAADDTVLPSGVVGEPYTAAVAATGGEPPYRWRAVDPLPHGLELAPDGTFGGRPLEGGTSTFALQATDAEGRTKRMLATFTAVLIPETVGCGGHLEGRFRAGVFDDGPDLSRYDDLAWLAIELPGDATTRVAVTVAGSGDLQTYVQRVNEVPGSWDLGGYAARSVKIEDGPRVLNIDAGTDPSLTEYAGQTLVPVLLAPREAGDWTLDVACSDGPVFETLNKFPKRLGDDVYVDYQVFGDNTGVRIWTDDPRPAWLTWDDTTGTVVGHAEEVESWEFTIHARSPDGRERTETALIGTFDVTDVPCGGTAPVVVSQAWTEGLHTKRYDPRGFHTFRVPFASPEPSRIDIRVTGGAAHYLGLARPDPGWQVYFGQAEEHEVNGTARIRVDSASYPASRDFVDAGELYFTAASDTEGALDGISVEVDCSYDPLPDVRGLPVLEVLEPVDLALGGIGGVPPYRWEADGLPEGLRIDATGRVTGQAGAAGTHRVTFRLTDSAGTVGEERLDWTIGSENACLGFREIGCGGAVNDELTTTWDEGAAGRDTFCIRDTSRDLGLVVYADDGELNLSLGDPGVSRRDELFEPGHSTWVAEIERHQVIGVPFDTFSFPNRLDYDRRPLFATIAASDPGTYALEVECP